MNSSAPRQFQSTRQQHGSSENIHLVLVDFCTQKLILLRQDLDSSQCFAGNDKTKEAKSAISIRTEVRFNLLISNHYLKAAPYSLLELRFDFFVVFNPSVSEFGVGARATGAGLVSPYVFHLRVPSPPLPLLLLMLRIGVLVLSIRPSTAEGGRDWWSTESDLVVSDARKLS